MIQWRGPADILIMCPFLQKINVPNQVKINIRGPKNSKDPTKLLPFIVYGGKCCILNISKYIFIIKTQYSINVHTVMIRICNHWCSYRNPVWCPMLSAEKGSWVRMRKETIHLSYPFPYGCMAACLASGNDEW